MKKLFLKLYAVFMFTAPTVWTVALCIKGHKWDNHQRVLIGIFIVAGIAAGLLIVSAIRSHKKPAKKNQRPECSNLFIMQYGDELLLTDGTNIEAHLPNHNL
jgi:hypothetical protein